MNPCTDNTETTGGGGENATDRDRERERKKEREITRERICVQFYAYVKGEPYNVLDLIETSYCTVFCRAEYETIPARASCAMLCNPPLRQLKSKIFPSPSPTLPPPPPPLRQFSHLSRFVEGSVASFPSL